MILCQSGALADLLRAIPVSRRDQSRSTHKRIVEHLPRVGERKVQVEEVPL